MPTINRVNRGRIRPHDYNNTLHGVNEAATWRPTRQENGSQTKQFHAATTTLIDGVWPGTRATSDGKQRSKQHINGSARADIDGGYYFCSTLIFWFRRLKTFWCKMRRRVWTHTDHGIWRPARGLWSPMFFWWDKSSLHTFYSILELRSWFFPGLFRRPSDIQMMTGVCWTNGFHTTNKWNWGGFVIIDKSLANKWRYKNTISISYLP